MQERQNRQNRQRWKQATNKCYVAGYIEQRMNKREARTEITKDMVLMEVSKIEFADITDFVTIERIKEGANGIEVKLNDKGKALELIGRHLGIFKNKVEISGLNEEKSKLGSLISQIWGRKKTFCVSTTPKLGSDYEGNSAILKVL